MREALMYLENNKTILILQMKDYIFFVFVLMKDEVENGGYYTIRNFMIYKVHLNCQSR